MPDSIIKELNQKAAQGKKLVPDDPVFTRGHTGVVIEVEDAEFLPVAEDAVKQVRADPDGTDFEPIDIDIRGADEVLDGVLQGANNLSIEEPVQQAMTSEGVTFADDVGNGGPVDQLDYQLHESQADNIPSEVQQSDAAEPVLSDGVAESEPVAEEPQRAGRGGRTVRRDYRRDATMLETGSRKWAYQLTVKKALEKFGKDAVKSLCAELL